ncbi:histidine phosphatase family protein [Rubrobacter marinus]|uniref:histidine phosphatase family protein n=1 Tax=Rubrobacter marinus TaxID=2653852 RepID=UPI00389ACBD3
MLPYWSAEISPAVTGGGRVLVVAHGNSLRALVKHLDGLSDGEVEELEIPPARPLVYEFDGGTEPARRYRLGRG